MTISVGTPVGEPECGTDGDSVGLNDGCNVGVGIAVGAVLVRFAGELVGIKEGANVGLFVVDRVVRSHRSPENPSTQIQLHRSRLNTGSTPSMVSPLPDPPMSAPEMHVPPLRHGLDAHGDVGVAVGAAVFSRVGSEVSFVGTLVGAEKGDIVVSCSHRSPVYPSAQIHTKP